ncbi:MBL fold metallo-hydrolase [Xylanimonas ulmi]|uniref:L-ascorbate metabolism protein UlaG (Beta-lactamase superfamily) n=1 Tax=Xylanimonas ulmi TaxID=228973 RepID=A0A4Q7M1T7_9MICO|nr:MBL fold metallo-hydrolase [Xylanibacterium ulmi]RZS60358.1 L-ascorbate metabolism protein UlaG (beta-lactamase superfamily) [Xylanibacterium ulmi]
MTTPGIGDGSPTLRVTHVGGPTVLIEAAGWRILTDPTFDPPGRAYGFGLGASSTKTAGPALTPEQIGPIDVVLLSHDQHADNLDDRGRALLPSAGTVVTTVPGARRLRAANVRGLRPGQSTVVSDQGRSALTIRATPARHGPWGSRPLVGATIGFALSATPGARAAVWITGDTVLHRPLLRTARALDVDVLILHLGAVRLAPTRRVRYTMDAAEGAVLAEVAGARVVVPVHYEGWSHFSEPEQKARDVLGTTRVAPSATITWLQRGWRTPIG